MGVGRIGRRRRRRRAVLITQAGLMGEAVVAHDQRGQAIGEGIDAGAGLGMRAFVGPDNVEA